MIGQEECVSLTCSATRKCTFSTHHTMTPQFPAQCPPRSSRSTKDVYWDQGPFEIQAFQDQYKDACKKNWICHNILNLANLVAETQGDGRSDGGGISCSPPKKKAAVRKASISYITCDFGPFPVESPLVPARPPIVLPLACIPLYF